MKLTWSILPLPIVLESSLVEVIEGGVKNPGFSGWLFCTTQNKFLFKLFLIISSPTYKAKSIMRDNHISEGKKSRNSVLSLRVILFLTKLSNSEKSGYLQEILFRTRNSLNSSTLSLLFSNKSAAVAGIGLLKGVPWAYAYTYDNGNIL